jgi:hypothetical protein
MPAAMPTKGYTSSSRNVTQGTPLTGPCLHVLSQQPSAATQQEHGYDAAERRAVQTDGRMEAHKVALEGVFDVIHVLHIDAFIGQGALHLFKPLDVALVAHIDLLELPSLLGGFSIPLYS